MYERHKVPNQHQKTYRKRFDDQKKDKAFKAWKKNRLDYQGGRCFYCLDHTRLYGSHIDHLIPLWRGGTNKRENLVVACAKCNTDKGIKILSIKKILELRQRINKVAKDDLERLRVEAEVIRSTLKNIE